MGLLDAFDRLLWSGKDGKPRPTVYALADLLSPRFDGWFDPVVMSYLLRLVPPFMIGSVVQLSDGTARRRGGQSRGVAVPADGPRADRQHLQARRPREAQGRGPAASSTTCTSREVDGQNVAAAAQVVEKAVAGCWRWCDDPGPCRYCCRGRGCHSEPPPGAGRRTTVRGGEESSR